MMKKKLSRKNSQVISEFSESLKIAFKNDIRQSFEEKSDKSAVSTPIIEIPSKINFNQKETQSNKKLSKTKPKSPTPMSPKILNLFNLKFPIKDLFESTSVENLPLNIQINFPAYYKYAFPIRVQEDDTVKKLKFEIEKKTGYQARSLMISVGDKKLENTEILRAHLDRKLNDIVLVEEVKIQHHIIKWKNEIKIIKIYPSDSILKMKQIIGKGLDKEFFEIIIRINDQELENNRDVFVYTTSEETEFLVELKEDYDEVFSKEDATEIREAFEKLTSDLTICRCSSIRKEAIASVLNNEPNKAAVLKDFTSNFHHKNCSKSTFTRHGSSASFISCMSSVTADEDSDMSNTIHDELQNVNLQNFVQESDVKYLVEVQNFKSFKRYLRQKIGRECNIRNVSLLYLYTRRIVSYIGFDETEEKTKLRDTMIYYSKKYFSHYYVDKIREKGGLAALALESVD